MSLKIRVYNISATNDYTVEYRDSSYNGEYTYVGEFSGGTTGVTISNLEFDTCYYVKITDLVTNQYSIQSIKTHDSKYFDCYDDIDFYITGLTCCGNYEIILVDKISPNGNNSSVISGSTKTYRIYSGLTQNITGATFITTGKTSPTTKIIYSTTGQTYSQIQMYFFVEHGDGNLELNNLSNPKRQGGFEVKHVTICNSDLFSPTPTPTPTKTPTPTPTPSATPSPSVSVTPTPTVTPTVTPTISVTPTVTPSVTPTISDTPAPTVTPTPSASPINYYSYGGTNSTYSTATAACLNKSCDRPYYTNIPSISIGQLLFDDSGLTIPFNGGGNWIAINDTPVYCTGSNWVAAQVDTSGLILSVVFCP